MSIVFKTDETHFKGQPPNRSSKYSPFCFCSSNNRGDEVCTVLSQRLFFLTPPSGHSSRSWLTLVLFLLTSHLDLSAHVCGDVNTPFWFNRWYPWRKNSHSLTISFFLHFVSDAIFNKFKLYSWTETNILSGAAIQKVSKSFKSVSGWTISWAISFNFLVSSYQQTLHDVCLTLYWARVVFYQFRTGVSLAHADTQVHTIIRPFMYYLQESQKIWFWPEI